MSDPDAATTGSSAAIHSRPALRTGSDGVVRCSWVGDDDEYERYHDDEWGREQHEPRALFEKICLEGFQAGLSWITILRRRPEFRTAFHQFDPVRVAAMTAADIEVLMQNTKIIRNRAKIIATIGNARAFLELDEPLSELMWSFAPARDRSRPRVLEDVPATTPESTRLSRALRARGFRFVGATTMYALMQSTGMVDDHLVGCHRALA